MTQIKPNQSVGEKRTFYDEVFLADVEIKVGSTSDAKLSAHTETLERKTKKGIEIKYLITLESKKDFYGLIHECLHLVQRIFTDRGIIFNSDNHELIAYYQTYWFKKLWRAINK